VSLWLIGLNQQHAELLSYKTVQQLRKPGVLKIARSLSQPGINWLLSEGDVKFDIAFDDIPLPTPADSVDIIADRIIEAAQTSDVVYVTAGHAVLGENANVRIYTRAVTEGLLAGVAGPATDSSDGLRDYDSLAAMMARLRDPETGCPWDREQTPQTLRRYLIEESYEVIEAIDASDPFKLSEELGDLLLQIAFHAQLAEESRQFTNGDIVRAIVLKLIRRHPHIFGSTVVSGSEQVLANWEQIKRTEKGNEHRKSILDGIPKDLPALMRALDVSKRVVRVGFEWPSVDEVLDKVEEEIAELRAELRSENGIDPARVKGELGDLLFTIVNVARQLKVDPEDALRSMTERFSRRFRRIEDHAEAEGRALSDLSLMEMEEIWQQAKREE